MLFRRLRAIGLWLFTIILVFSGISWVVFGIWLRPKVPATLDFHRIYNKDILIETTEALLTTLVATHPGITQEASSSFIHDFSLLSRDEFLRQQEELLQHLTHDMSGRAYLRHLLVFFNALGDEHTEIPFFLPAYYPQIATVKKFPYQLLITQEAIYLDEDIYDDRGVWLAQGSELEAINGVDIAELLPLLVQLFSGRDLAQRHNYLTTYYPEALYLLFGEEEMILTTASYEATITPRLYERAPQLAYQYAIIDKSLYLVLRDFEDTKEFRRFLATMFREAKHQQITSMRIDLRDSRGGATSAGDRLLAYLTHTPPQQLIASYLKVSEVSREYFLSFIPSALRWTFFQYYLPPLNMIFRIQLGETVKLDFPPIKPDKRDLFSGEVEVWINAGTMSSADLLYYVIVENDLGSLVGERRKSVNHFGNQVLYTTEVGVKMLIPTSFNVASVE